MSSLEMVRQSPERHLSRFISILWEDSLRPDIPQETSLISMQSQDPGKAAFKAAQKKMQSSGGEFRGMVEGTVRQQGRQQPSVYPALHSQ